MDAIKKRQLVVASGNAHKLREIAEIFTDFEVVSQKQMGFDFFAGGTIIAINIQYSAIPIARDKLSGKILSVNPPRRVPIVQPR